MSKDSGIPHSSTTNPIMVQKAIEKPTELKYNNSTLWLRRMFAEYRTITKEKVLEKEGINVYFDESTDSPIWDVTMKCTNDESLAYGQSFKLEVQFYPTYPMRPPYVRFVTPAPLHSKFNDFFLIDILDKCCWNPVVHVEKILIEIQSLL